MDRYDFGYGFHKSPIGVWVKYTDHLSVIADLRTELERLRHDIARHVAICADQAAEIDCEEKRVADLMDQVAGMAMKIERLRERTKKLEGRLLHHYDALSDWPLTEGHAKEMCRRVETLFPDLFGTAAAKEE